MRQGRIQKALSGFYYVESDGEILTCRARGKFRKDGVSPLVGDFVEARETGPGEGFIERILPRRNAFARPAVANIDRMVILASAAPPVTDPFLIDRMMSVAVLKGCAAVVVLNKSDLDPAEKLYNLYRASGVTTLRVSAVTGDGMDALRTLLQDGLSAFTGNSGVGKSSVLNALDPAFCLKTGEVSDALGRGRHTTRHVEIYRLPSGGEAVDTPGFSSFDTEELNLELKARLPETFPEFRPFTGNCQFIGCSHTKEKGCAVLDAVRRGEIQPSRHSSYVRLYEELRPLREWQSVNRKGPADGVK